MDLEKLNHAGRQAVLCAQEEARRLNHNYLGTEHLLLGLVVGQGAPLVLLANVGVNVAQMRERVEEIIGTGHTAPSGHIPFTPRSQAVIEFAEREAANLGFVSVGPEHILLGLLREGAGVAALVLMNLGVDLNRLRQQVLAVPRQHDGTAGLNLKPAFAMHSTSVRGRRHEIQRVAQVLLRHTRNNPVVVGPPGIGRRSVVAGLAQALVVGGVAPSLRNKRLYEATNEVLADLSGRRDVILYVDDVAHLDPATHDAIVRGAVQVVAIATHESFAGLSPQLAQALQPVPIAEISIGATAEVLLGVRGRLQNHHGLTIADDALAAVAQAARRLLPDTPLPVSAIDLLDEVCSRVQGFGIEPRPTPELDARIDEVRRQKTAAIDGGDFPSAARLRVEEKTLIDERARAQMRPGIVDATAVAEVTRNIAAERGLPLEDEAPTAPRPTMQANPFANSTADLWMIS